MMSTPPTFNLAAKLAAQKELQASRGAHAHANGQIVHGEQAGNPSNPSATTHSRCSTAVSSNWREDVHQRHAEVRMRIEVTSGAAYEFDHHEQHVRMLLEVRLCAQLTATLCNWAGLHVI